MNTMLKQLLPKVEEVTMEAAQLVASMYSDAKIVKMKGDDNPLTEADEAANKLLETKLPLLFPEAAWLSEETEDDAKRLDKDWVWIVDPIDGTREFTLGIPEFVVSVGLCYQGKALLGCMINPATQDVFSGIVGVGATLNGKPIKVADHQGFDGARLICSRSEMKKGWFDQYRELGIEPQPVGSVAYKFGLVAAGQAEATFTPRPRSEWDIAGGVAIVEAAGGRCSDKEGQPFRFNNKNILVDGILASNDQLHDELLSLMSSSDNATVS